MDRWSLWIGSFGTENDSGKKDKLVYNLLRKMTSGFLKKEELFVYSSKTIFVVNCSSVYACKFIDNDEFDLQLNKTKIWNNYQLPSYFDESQVMFSVSSYNKQVN